MNWLTLLSSGFYLDTISSMIFLSPTTQLSYVLPEPSITLICSYLFILLLSLTHTSQIYVSFMPKKAFLEEMSLSCNSNGSQQNSNSFKQSLANVTCYIIFFPPGNRCKKEQGISKDLFLLHGVLKRPHVNCHLRCFLIKTMIFRQSMLIRQDYHLWEEVLGLFDPSNPISVIKCNWPF